MSIIAVMWTLPPDAPRIKRKIASGGRNSQDGVSPRPIIQRHGIVADPLSVFTHAIGAISPICFVNPVVMRQRYESATVSCSFGCGGKLDSAGCLQLRRSLVWLGRNALIDVIEQ